MAISENIRILRIQKNMTQKQLGDLLYVSDKTISKWERGRSIPDIITIKKIALILEVDYQFIIEGERYNNKNNSIWDKFKIFTFTQRHFTSLFTIIFLWIIILLLTSSKVAYFIGLFAIFVYSVLLAYKRSKWYILNTLVIVISFILIINDFISFDLYTLVIILVFLTILLMIVYIIVQHRDKSSISSTDFIGNINLGLVTFIFMSAFKKTYTIISGDQKLLINKQPMFVIYIFTLIGLLFLLQYFYINKSYQNKILNYFKGRLLKISGTTLLVLILSVMLSTTVKITSNKIAKSSVYVSRSYLPTPFTNSQTNELQSIYGATNVTLSRYVEATQDLQIYAYTSNFIINGVSVNMSAGRRHAEKVTLLYGDVWEEKTTSKVIVIDKDTALIKFEKVNAVGEYISINQEEWKVIGVVTNTKTAKSHYDRLVSLGINKDDIKTDSYVYIPYYFKDYSKFEIAKEAYDTYIINTQKFISSNKDVKNILKILVDGNNYYLDNQGVKFLKVGTVTGRDMLIEYVDIKEGILISSMLLVTLIIIIETRYYINKKRYKK